ncbi:MAG: carboxyl transferase domain-containing protein [Acidimicrobiales bacterium]
MSDATTAPGGPDQPSPRRPVVLRYVDDWDELAGQIAADRALGLRASPVRQAVTAWLDPGSFVETGTLARRAATSYRGGDTLDDAAPETIPADGLVAGWGRLRGRLVFVAADDPALGSPVRGGAGAAKAGRMRHHALAQGAPIVQILGAARLEPGTFIGAEAVRFGYGLDLDFEVGAARRIPKIAIVTHPITEQAALEAGWSHLVLLAGPHGAIDGLAGDAALAAGLADAHCPDLPAALAEVGRALDRLPPSWTDEPPAGGEGEPWSLALWPRWHPEVSTVLAAAPGAGPVAGWADLPDGAELHAGAAAKVARLARFCAAFSLPLVLAHSGWSLPSPPGRADLDEVHRLGEALARCPAVVEVSHGRPLLEPIWGLRPTVALAVDGPGSGPAPGPGSPGGEEVDAVVAPDAVPAAVAHALGLIAVPRPARHDDPRLRHQLPRRLQ